MMNFSNSKDERLLAFYNNVRRQVELDIRSVDAIALLVIA
jgi:hypothetical protein